MLEIVNPTTEETIDRLESDSEETIQAKFEAAGESQPDWAATPLDQRIAAIAAFRGMLVDELHPLAETLTAEIGKPITQARDEVWAAVSTIDFFLGAAEKALAPQTMREAGDFVERITWEPLGVIAHVSAWSHPFRAAASTLVPALLAGNAVLYKPSEFAALTGLSIADLLWEAGVPPNVSHVVVGAGDAGEMVLEHDLDGVFFVGSRDTGVRIAEALTPALPRLHMDLSCKAAAYVCDDADVDDAAAVLAVGSFENCGQASASIERIYVEEPVYDEFVQAFVRRVKSFVVGDPAEPETFIGPLTRKTHLGKLELQVADAVQRGAELRAGGKRMGGRGFFFEPTVLTNVDHTMTLMHEEGFGPIVGVMPVSSDEEGLVRMRDSQYGLTAAVFSGSRRRAEGILSGMDTGTAYWNCCNRVSPYLPWTGRRNSGIGTSLSTEGLRAFLHPKAWHLRGY